MDQIPGSAAIGYGFNALGSYDPSSLMSQAFKTSFELNKTYTYPPTGASYTVPDNATVVSFATAQGGTHVFQSQYDLQTFLSIQAGISGSYGAFGMQVGASYSSAIEEWGNCYYGLTDAWIGTWMIVLQETDASHLDPEFWDVLMNQLPDALEPATAWKFFEFFQTYGTHYVHSVGVGGSFAYYEGVAVSGSYSLEQVNANLALEYNAVFVDAASQSQVDWSALGLQWANSRTTSINALGGDAQALGDLTPIYGTSASNSYQAWLSSIQTNPAPVLFILHPWDELLPLGSSSRVALQEALNLYMNFSITVAAMWDGTAAEFLTTAGGVAISPFWSWPQAASTGSGIQVTLLDSESLQPTFSAVYYFENDASNWEQLFAQLMNDLNTLSIAGGQQWCCCNVFNYPWSVPPSSDFLEWMGQFGITASQWIDQYGNCGGGEPSFNYIAVGLAGGPVEEVWAFNYASTPAQTEVTVSPLADAG